MIPSQRDLDRVSASVAETAAKCRRGAETLADDATGAVASFNALREEAEADVHKCGAEATLQVIPVVCRQEVRLLLSCFKLAKRKLVAERLGRPSTQEHGRR